jgi:hypothetical protein
MTACVSTLSQEEIANAVPQCPRSVDVIQTKEIVF